MDVNNFKTKEEINKEAQEKMEEESRFTWEKATKMLSSFKDFISHGCVSEEVYKDRRAKCEGIPGETEPCEFNFLRESDNRVFCGSCGCGQRPMATLYIKGKEWKDDNSVRLWMPKSNCPKELHKDEEGTGTFKPVGGKLRQLANFAKASIEEVGRFTGTTSDEAVLIAQGEIESNVNDDDDFEKLVEYMEDDSVES